MNKLTTYLRDFVKKEFSLFFEGSSEVPCLSLRATLSGSALLCAGTEGGFTESGIETPGSFKMGSGTGAVSAFGAGSPGFKSASGDLLAF